MLGITVLLHQSKTYTRIHSYTDKATMQEYTYTTLNYNHYISGVAKGVPGRAQQAFRLGPAT